MLLLDRLEVDKGKQARLLAEHLTWIRTLPSTEQELQFQLEKKTTREIKRHQTTTDVEANKASKEQMEADKLSHEAAMVAHLT